MKGEERIIYLGRRPIGSFCLCTKLSYFFNLYSEQGDLALPDFPNTIPSEEILPTLPVTRPALFY